MAMIDARPIPAHAPPPADAAPPERRAVDRWPVDGTVVIHEVAGRDFGRRHVMHLRDGSAVAFGGRLAGPITPGTDVSATFAGVPSGLRRGTVVRCRPCGAGYDVAIRFARVLAA